MEPSLAATVDPGAVATAVPEPVLARRAAGGCTASRNALVETHLPFVIGLAQQYRGMGVPLEDLVHEGALGLFEAAARFDPDRGTKFLTFASWWVRKTLVAALGQGPCVVAVPGYQRRRQRQIRNAENELRARLGRAPEDREVADHMGLSADKVRRTRQGRRFEVRLESPVADPDGKTIADLLADTCGPGPEADLLDREAVRELRTELRRLDPRERLVLAWRYGLDGEPPFSLQEISERLALSRERVRQIEWEARRRLRRRLSRLRHASRRPRATAASISAMRPTAAS